MKLKDNRVASSNKENIAYSCMKLITDSLFGRIIKIPIFRLNSFQISSQSTIDNFR